MSQFSVTTRLTLSRNNPLHQNGHFYLCTESFTYLYVSQIFLKMIISGVKQSQNTE